ncbi:hypothetical protein [Motiliproteus sediminis]|uniref:hypothetical protein n=1 Tax=Motiliproteus sediminis TaxID=1468178 RepID=UPI001AEF986F|nr:hypothetical protein [Motiliproteus sediminis]
MIHLYKNPASRLVFCAFEGDVSDQQLLDHLQRYNQQYGSIEGLYEFCDLRAITEADGLNVSTLLEVAEQDYHRPRLAGGKLALLATSPLTFGLARAYQSIAEMGPNSVRIIVTDNEDEAIRFLCCTEDDLNFMRQQRRKWGLD